MFLPPANHFWLKLIQFIKSIFKSGDNQVFSTILFEVNRPEISIRVSIRIRPDGSLEVAGQDFGELVNELQGKSDYEYYLLVSPGPKEELKKKLQLEGHSLETDYQLLSWFQRHYSKNEAFSEITKLLERLEVKHDASFW